jgi:hypothetical protein
MLRNARQALTVDCRMLPNHISSATGACCLAGKANALSGSRTFKPFVFAQIAIGASTRDSREPCYVGWSVRRHPCTA